MKYENYLCHHGVKGMKWGIRKSRKKTSIFSRKKKDPQKNQNGTKKSDGSNKPTKKRTSIKNLSDQELQNKVRRLQLEKQYRDLKRDEVSTGRKILGEVLKTSGKTLGIQVANYIGGKAINKAFNDEVVKNVGKKGKKSKTENKAA